MVVQAEVSSPGGAFYQFCFSAMTFISVLLGLMDFSDIVILCSRPKVVAKCFNMPLLSFGLFS